jgi:CHAD domain-containing protein
MAKARDVPGLHADIGYREAAARTVAVRAQELFEQADGVLDTSDIERVHDMRVASRRLRAVLEIYEPCFPRKPLRDVLSDVKALADALGARRDPDVHLAQLDEFAGAVKAADRPGVKLFAERVRGEQAVGNEVLSAALARIEDTDLRGRLSALAASASPQHDPRKSFGLQRPEADGRAQAAGPGRAQPAGPDVSPEATP